MTKLQVQIVEALRELGAATPMELRDYFIQTHGRSMRIAGAINANLTRLRAISVLKVENNMGFYGKWSLVI